MTSANPMVSVIVPNYNHAPYLRQRLDSILGQTFQDFELLLLDDCSTDESVAILTEYAQHPKVSHFIVNELNSGSPFAQWRKGIELSKGQYIWIAESDDCCQQELLETLINPLSRSHSTQIAYCASRQLDQHGALHNLIRSPLAEWSADSNNAVRGTEVIAKKLHRQNIIPNASAVVIRKSALTETVLHAAKEYRLNGDWFVWYEILRTGNISYCDEPFNFFRFHVRTARSEVSADGTNVVEWLKLLKRMLENRDISSTAARRSASAAYALYCNQSPQVDLSGQNRQLVQDLAAQCGYGTLQRFVFDSLASGKRMRERVQRAMQRFLRYTKKTLGKNV